MSYSKVIPVGEAGQVMISEEGGIASVELSLAQSVGGGSVAGVAKASVSAKIEVSAVELIDAGLGLAAAKFPSASALIEAAKAAIDAELAKA